MVQRRHISQAAGISGSMKGCGNRLVNNVPKVTLRDAKCPQGALQLSFSAALLVTHVNHYPALIKMVIMVYL